MDSSNNLDIGGRAAGLLEAAYTECVFDEVSTCKIIKADEKLAASLADNCRSYLSGKHMSAYAEVNLDKHIKVKRWVDFVKLFLRSVEISLPDNERRIKGFAEVIDYLFSSGNIQLEKINSIQHCAYSLKNAVVHYLECEPGADEKKSMLRSYIMGDYIKISSLRGYQVNDVKICINKRNALDFLTTAVKILLSFNLKAVSFLIYRKANNSPLFLPAEIIKDFIDLTTSSRLEKTLAVFVIDNQWDQFITKNDALKTRLDNCGRVLGGEVPVLTPVIDYNAIIKDSRGKQIC